MVLAPLTKGGNLPYRRLLVELGATVTTSEMALAYKVCKGMRGEMALLRRAPEEQCFGVQLAGRKPAQMARASQIAQERGASFVDVNLGCPIDLFCRRGIGAALMTRARRVGEIVAAMREAVDIPVTVKMRLGWDEEKPTFTSVAEAAVEAGASAITLHGRSRKQRYKRAANWDAVAQLVQSLPIPVIGNGDILTWRDAVEKRERTGCAGVMVARGALIKPWIFSEIQHRRDFLLTPSDRLALLRRYRDLAREHFGDDDHGHQRVHEFLMWHLEFFARYRPVPSDTISPDEHPLIQTRMAPPEALPGIEGLLLRDDEEARRELATQILTDPTPGPASAADVISAILSGP